MGNMGSVISDGMRKTMEENMKKQMAFQAENQKAMLEKQMTMQQLLMQRQMAMQISRSREMFNWISGFAATLSVVLVAGVAKTKKPQLLAPLLPLSFGVGYLYDMCYGTQLERIRDNAGMMILEQNPMLMLPNGNVTVEEVENKIKGK